MAAPRSCGICGGPVQPYLLGREEALEPGALSPTCHVPGQHGDLYRCRDCGTVQQPALPGGQALTDLYRGMEDIEYLAEEQGRRITANRLIDLVAAHAPGGRFLDVGCG